MSDEWQPIETAPRDRTLVIVWRPECKYDWPRRMGLDFFERGTWMKSRPIAMPTHWMPLPQPPETNK